MNIGDTVKLIKKEYPSVTISRIRFLEKEGLLKPKRSKGGTRSFTEKDVHRIKKILDLQENQFYSLKAIKNNPQLLTSNSSNSETPTVLYTLITRPSQSFASVATRVYSPLSVGLNVVPLDW